MTTTHVSPFLDASALLQPNPEELSYGTVMADLDNDGLPEILVVTVNGPNRLYKWKSDRLVDVAPPALQDPHANGIGVACADYSNSGYLDVYLLNTSAFLGPFSDPDRLLLNEGGLRFRDILVHHPERNVAAGRSVCWLDLDGDGHYAAYVCNYAAPCRLYTRSNAGELIDVAPAIGLDQVTGGRAAVAANISGNGRMDLFTANENDANRFFLNRGRRIFHEVASEVGLDDPREHPRGVAACDYDRNGRVDLVWGNWEGPHRLMQQQPDGTFRDQASEAFAQPSRVRTLVVFDYDNDGWEDIFINNIGQSNRLFHNNGDGTFTEVDPGPLALPEGLGTGATVGDLNGDGYLDLFIAHGESARQSNALFLNAPNGNKWLRIHPLTEKGAPAIGTQVVVYAEGDDRPILRFIDGGSGYLCQMEPVAHAGLGQAARASRVDIRYTTGRQFRLTNVDANQNVYIRPEGEEWTVDMVRMEE